MRRRQIMSMLAALFGLVLLAAPVAAAATPPAEFGSDWHDPVTAAPPIATPDTRSCTVTVADTQFKDFTPYTGTYTPPADCGTRWSKVVLHLDGSVAGRQYDRLGYLHIGGVEILRTSTPEPSPDGISWSAEKDVTRYASTLRAQQPVEMLIGNVVDDTYTGVINVKVTLTFYTAEGRTKAAPAASTPDQVIPLDSTTLTTPRNSERIVAEVYATGSGGGCEEFWYLAVPADVPYSCQAGDDGPNREVQVTVDGQLAGIASPYPHVWTGGWSNPFLWYVIPAPRAFDVQPIDYDLTPFAGLLNDGKQHRVQVSVVGVPEGQSGWSVPTNILVWQDAHREHVTGALTVHKESAPAVSTSYDPGTDLRTLDAKGSHQLTVSGYVNTSHGRVTTTVHRTLTAASTHTWNADETTDALKARWTDDETHTVNGTATRTRRTYTMDGAITIGSDDRLRTAISLGDHAAVTGATRSRLDDTYTGDATWTLNVPRDQRHAVGTSAERYRLTGDGACYDRSLATAQGTLTEDRRRC
ncbi:peptide-N4-asparagine amidase [Actinacidiphila soli]|uniref:peptide-N4-asparagine amidase n=1 Tax=Actinacidiphila soli TaxID=2487275 RepID=UPI000FCC58D4|nr:peptide-N4-asparagine amidase [Actinacidiphila soli]